MPSRTLVEALRAHLTCSHPLAVEVQPTSVVLTHDGGVQRWNTTGGDAAAGSAIFHEAARRILGDGEHEMVPLNISDAEYAGFTYGS